MIINESQSAKPDEQSNHGGRSARAHQNQGAQLRSSTPEIPEDFKFRFKDELQKIVDKISADLEEMSKRKEQEILS